jgi:low affinity Fe/Cu permease
VGDLQSGVRRSVRLRSALSAAAQTIVDGAGSAATSALVVILVAAWAIVGTLRGFTEAWLTLLFAVSAAVTMVMVFFIQHTTGRQIRALSLKLDELVRTHPDASDAVIGAEHGPLHEQDRLERSAEGQVGVAPLQASPNRDPGPGPLPD